jgi:hypothetical protein
VRSEGLSDIIVIDTNVISYVFKRDSRGDLYKPHLEGGKLMMIAAQTFAELELLPLNNGWGINRHTSLRSYLKKFVSLRPIKPSLYSGPEYKPMLNGWAVPSPSVTHGLQPPH